jgi:hypothetical protein
MSKSGICGSSYLFSRQRRINTLPAQRIVGHQEKLLRLLGRNMRHDQQNMEEGEGLHLNQSSGKEYFTF